MKWIVFLLIVPFSLNAQNINKVRRSGVNTSHAQSKINEAIDTVNTLKGIYKTDGTINSIDYIDLNTDYSDGHVEGRVHWNDDDKTLEVGLDQGSILQVGQEIHVRCTNKTGATISNGAVVYVNGAQGNRPTIRLADADSVSSFNTIGMATQDIANNATGYVTIVGLARDINTSAFSAGDVLYVDTIAGAFTNVRHSSPINATVVGIVVRSNATEGIVGVRVTTIPRLAWLSDVDARGNQSDDDVLVWDSDSLEWKARDSLSLDAINYKNTYWDDLRVPLTNTRINPANSEPDFEDRGDGIFAWGFDADADSSHALNFIAQTPHKRKNGTEIEAHVHWGPSTTNTGSVRWRLVYSISLINGTFSTPDTLWITDAAAGTAHTHQLADFGMLVDSDQLGISSMIMGSISRVGDDPEDTYTGSAYGYEIDFHYEIDSPGSREETEK